MAAAQAHDAQIASSGITTVFDALRCGMDDYADLTGEDMSALAQAIEHCAESGRLRAEHRIHDAAKSPRLIVLKPSRCSRM